MGALQANQWAPEAQPELHPAEALARSALLNGSVCKADLLSVFELLPIGENPRGSSEASKAFLTGAFVHGTIFLRPARDPSGKIFVPGPFSQQLDSPAQGLS